MTIKVFGMEGFNTYDTEAQVMEGAFNSNSGTSIIVVGGGHHTGNSLDMDRSSIGPNTPIDPAWGCMFSFSFKLMEPQGGGTTDTKLMFFKLQKGSAANGLAAKFMHVGITPEGHLIVEDHSAYPVPPTTITVPYALAYGSGVTWHTCCCTWRLAGSGSLILKVYINDQLLVEMPFSSTASLIYPAVGYVQSHIQIDNLSYLYEELSTEPVPVPAHSLAVETLLPTGDTTQADFAGDYTGVDDPYGYHDGDGSTIGSNNVADASEFALAPLSYTPALIYAVQPQIAFKLDNPNVAGVYFKYQLTTGGATNFAGDGANYVVRFGPAAQQDPDGNPWTATSVNDVRVGVKYNAPVV